MAKKPTSTRQQLGVRLSDDAMLLLEALQTFYAQRAGLSTPLSQSDTVDVMVRETAKAYKLKGGK